MLTFESILKYESHVILIECVKKSPEKYGNLLKFDFRSFLAYLVSFFIIFQLNLTSSITEKSVNIKKGSY